MFCGPGGVGTPLRAGTLDDVFYGLLAAHMGCGVQGARDYSVHSFRSYLASAMLAANCSDAEIQMALRWSSAQSVATYKNVNMEMYGEAVADARAAYRCAGCK